MVDVDVPQSQTDSWASFWPDLRRRELFATTFAQVVPSPCLEELGGTFRGLEKPNKWSGLFTRLSVASGLTELAAFGGQDVSCVLLDDTEDSVIIVYDRTSVGQVVFAGLAGVRDCFTGLFVCSVDSVIIVHDQTSGG